MCRSRTHAASDRAGMSPKISTLPPRRFRRARDEARDSDSGHADHDKSIAENHRPSRNDRAEVLDVDLVPGRLDSLRRETTRHAHPAAASFQAKQKIAADLCLELRRE